jgi:hypothetical protein
MNAMQYAITLPADYDMQIIRQRVATRGHLLDDRAGLALKAYCIQERGTAGANVNQYAPFYLWHDTEALMGFLLGDGFRGVCDSFGCPVVQHWITAAVAEGPGRADTPAWATRISEIIPEDVDLRTIVPTAKRRVSERARHPELHTSAVALDPRRWELVQFDLWTEIPQGIPGTRYQVLHLSTPKRA